MEFTLRAAAEKIARFIAATAASGLAECGPIKLTTE